MKIRAALMLVLALVTTALTACAPQSNPNTQIPPTTVPTEEPSMDPNANPLAGTSWQLSDLNGTQPVDEGRGPANLEFLADGRIGGTSGCNRYFGPFTVSGTSLTTGQLGSTMMACSEPLMQQEQTFLGILGAAASYTLADDTLTITADDGRTLTFTRA